MNREALEHVVMECLGAVAPEFDYHALKPDAPMRDQVDIDSYDFLNFIVSLHEKLGVDVPEADYQKLVTLNDTIDYLKSRVG